jgi:hypothetical protein
MWRTRNKHGVLIGEFFLEVLALAVAVAFVARLAYVVVSR